MANYFGMHLQYIHLLNMIFLKILRGRDGNKSVKYK